MTNRLIRLMCVIAVAWTLGLVAAPQAGIQGTLAQVDGQEDGLGTPPADTESPPDQIQTTEPLPWGLFAILAIVAIVAAFLLWRFFRSSTRRTDPPDRPGGLPPANPPQ